MTIGQLAELRDWVLEFLRLTALSAEEQRDPAVAQRLEYCIEQLWVLMRQDLLDLASQWLRSELGRNQINFEGFDDAKVKLALIALEGIYLRLPGTEIDPEKNLKGLLCTIAKRTLIDENNKLQPLAALYAKHFAKGRSVKDTEDLHMWNPLEIERGGNKSEDVADPSSFNWENDLIVAFNRTDQRKAMLLAIDTLPQRDQNIIRLRYEAVRKLCISKEAFEQDID